MKILYFSDPHLASAGPISRIDNYQETCFRKLDEIRSIAIKEKVECILCGGDWFHLKNWMRNPYSLTNALIDYTKSLPCKVYGIFGDHDVPDRNESSLHKQPLMTVCKATNLKLIEKTTLVMFDIDGENKVWITGASKTDNYEGDQTNYIPKLDGMVNIAKEDVHIHLSHGDLWDKPPMYSPHTLYSQLTRSTVDFHFNGHVHDDLGEVRVNSKTLIINRGSLTRGNLTESNINRKVTVTLLDTTKRTLQYIELKSALPANKIFDLDKVEEVKKAEADIMRLGELIRLESGNVELNGPESIRQLVREAKSISEPVRTKIFDLLDRAESFQ